ncbi:hypothetical protein EDB81DRAFT_766137 [Dactylonectria macrodidyma]|uniref:Uncharacterized protein n=1 Tax=Dactylonectria macrodidyma TaxID=307937 RepID=A0A9P9IJV7_9HYPO|nr:hypothetical protein EDB81DRAFT_766137 [Dactylonectria macrodidyma]
MEKSQKNPLSSQAETKELKDDMELIKETIKSQTETIRWQGEKLEQLQAPRSRHTPPQDAPRSLPLHYQDLSALGKSVEQSGTVPTPPQTSTSKKIAAEAQNGGVPNVQGTPTVCMGCGGGYHKDDSYGWHWNDSRWFHHYFRDDRYLPDPVEYYIRESSSAGTSRNGVAKNHWAMTLSKNITGPMAAKTTVIGNSTEVLSGPNLILSQTAGSASFDYGICEDELSRNRSFGRGSFYNSSFGHYHDDQRQQRPGFAYSLTEKSGPRPSDTDHPQRSEPQLSQVARSCLDAIEREPVSPANNSKPSSPIQETAEIPLATKPHGREEGLESKKIAEPKDTTTSTAITGAKGPREPFEYVIYPGKMPYQPVSPRSDTAIPIQGAAQADPQAVCELRAIAVEPSESAQTGDSPVRPRTETKTTSQGHQTELQSPSGETDLSPKDETVLEGPPNREERGKAMSEPETPTKTRQKIILFCLVFHPRLCM